jgi:hypothetical protein
MVTWLSRLHNVSVESVDAGERHGLLRALWEAVTVCRRSWDAADHYEQLRSMSDAALTERGLTRKDLARVAFDRLSQDD